MMTNISQGRVVNRLRCGGIFSGDFITNLRSNFAVKEFWKSFCIWRSYTGKITVIAFWLSHSGPGFVSPCSVSINKKFQFYTAKIHQWHWQSPNEKSRLHHPPCSRAWTLAGCNLVLSRCIMIVFVHLTLYIYCLRDVRVVRCGHVTWLLQRWSVTSLKCVMQLGRVITRNWFTAKWPLFS